MTEAEELERLRQAERERKRVLDDGRKRGQVENATRAAENRKQLLGRAMAIKLNKPFLTPERLALEVMEWSRLPGGPSRRYAYRTILELIRKTLYAAR